MNISFFFTSIVLHYLSLIYDIPLKFSHLLSHKLVVLTAYPISMHTCLTDFPFDFFSAYLGESSGSPMKLWSTEIGSSKSSAQSRPPMARQKLYLSHYLPQHHLLNLYLFPAKRKPLITPLKSHTLSQKVKIPVSYHMQQ